MIIHRLRYLFGDFHEFLNLVQGENPFDTDFFIFGIIPSVYSLPETVRFYIQNFTHIAGHVIIFPFKAKFIYDWFGVFQIWWANRNL